MQLTGTRRSNRDTADILRSMVTVQYGLQKSGLSLGDFAQKYVDYGRAEKSNLTTRWLMGDVAISMRNASRLDRMIPGMRELYLHPVFQLLRYPEVSSRKVRSLLRRYQNPRRLPFWLFGDEQVLRWAPPLPREDTSTVWQRGDLDGFTVILGLVRDAESQGDVGRHMLHIQHLYRAFAAVARIPWFRPYARLLRWCVERIHGRNVFSRTCVRVMWPIIHAQIRAPQHETLPHRWPRDPRTGRAVEPVDPTFALPLPLQLTLRNPLEDERWRRATCSRAARGSRSPADRAAGGAARGRGHWKK